MPTPDLTPEQRAAVVDHAKANLRIDPLVVGVLTRAVEVARREGNDTVTLKEVFEAFLHCTITPALIHHLQAARSVLEDERGVLEYLDDTAVLAAQLSDGSSSVSQILERHVTDMDALVADVRRGVRENSDTP